MRCDWNVPLKNSTVQDSTRLDASLPTLEYLLAKNCRLIVASHLGRPNPKRPEPGLSLEPVAQLLGQRLGKEVLFTDLNEASSLLAKTMPRKNVLMLENLRFYEGENANCPAFALQLKNLADVFINEAFGACHRKCASLIALPGLFSHKAMGFLLKKELEALGALYNPPRPFWCMLGGAKVSDKLPLIEGLFESADGMAIGGAQAYSFLQTQKPGTVGDSMVEPNCFEQARKILHRAQTRQKDFLLPIDHTIARTADGEGITIAQGLIPSGFKGWDIGPKTVEQFCKHLAQAKSVFVNGPMGLFERPHFAKGSLELIRFIANLEGVFTVLGGGDSALVAKLAGVNDKFCHISTGGGAALEFLKGPLPGVEALRVQYKHKELGS